MPDNPINSKHETRHFKEQDSIVRYIEDQYRRFVNEIAPLIASGAGDATIRRRMNALLRQMAGRIEVRIETGVQRSWQISNDKTFAYLDKRLKGIELPKGVTASWYDPNEKAMQRFIQRKTDGLNLSDRVWNSVKGTQRIINKKLSDGAYVGKSAASVARQLRSELKDPTGEEKPGQGVYKSPVRNTERLTRTETNVSYRSADHEAWKNNPIIIGYEINLSATHSAKVKARCELCQTMKGKYPVWFKWTGWHPNCLCFKTPILMERKYLDKYLELIVMGQDSASAIAALRKEAGAIANPPSLLKSWVTDNAERVAGWKNRPYWWKDNIGLVNSYLS